MGRGVEAWSSIVPKQPPTGKRNQCRWTIYSRGAGGFMSDSISDVVVEEEKYVRVIKPEETPGGKALVNYNYTPERFFEEFIKPFLEEKEGEPPISGVLEDL
jgi:hypothetical protein